MKEAFEESARLARRNVTDLLEALLHVVAEDVIALGLAVLGARRRAD